MKLAIILVLAVLPVTADPQIIGIGVHLAKMFAQAAPLDLERVLAAMDNSAKSFHTAEANFTFDQFTKLVNDHDLQKGKLYFRRQGNDVEMAADFSEPRQYALYSNGKAQLYNPKIDTVNEYKADKNRSQVDAMLLLGFGGGGHSLLANFDVSYAGTESINGVKTDKLELTPKSKEMRNNIARIVLWIDPARGVSLQQQMLFPAGDYRMAQYADIQLNKKLPGDAFKLKTTSKTKFISPNS